jgi:trans-aconitate methyltransferase
MVTAIDASAGMTQLASEWIGQSVLHTPVEAYEPNLRFDGIWASASLLHLPEARLAGVFRKLGGWLEDKGVLYVSFKQGKGERTSGERAFTDMTQSTLRRLLADQPCYDVSHVWLSGDVQGRKTQWVNAIAHKSTSEME